jgi:hypothetical protein
MARTLSLLIAAAVLLCAAAPQAMAVLAFPGAEGFAASITGGRGGTVYHVTNLNDTGAGSFRDAVGTAGRIVIFDVGGVINITSPVSFANNVTVAGQTAPGGGIVVYGDEVSLSSHNNIIIRYMTFRMGIAGSDGDKALNMTTSYNIMLDHVSVAWGRWDTFGITSNSYVITLQNCMFTESIDPQRLGGLIDSSDRITLARNLFADNQSRNPKGKGNLQYINNVVYNWGSNGYCGGHSSAAWYQDLINNYFVAGPSSSLGNILTQFTSTDTVYNSGNYVDLDLTDVGGDGRPEGRIIVASDFIGNSAGDAPTFITAAHNAPSVAVPIMSAADAFAYVVSQAGNSLRRDTVDQRVIGYVKSLGTQGAIIANEAAVGGQPAVAGGTPPTDTDQDGIPDYFETAIGTNPGVADNNGDLNGDGYTNVEEYLNWLGGPHAQVAIGSAYVDVDLRPYTGGFATTATYTLSNVTHGTAAMLSDGHTARFTQAAGYWGLAAFTYTVNDGRVASETVSVLAQGGAGGDATAPTPNPMTWATVPYALSASSIGMVATTATDASGVAYYFACTLGGGHDSGWQSGTTYTDTGLAAGTTYRYRVLAHDLSANLNETGWSTEASATTQSAQAAPTYVGTGTMASGTGTITPALPSGLATGDVLLLFVETANQAVSISNQNGGTWTAVTNSPQGTGTAAGAAATRLTAFWSRYNGTQGAATVSDSGDHQIGRIVAFRGCISSGNPWNVTAGGVEATADTSGAIPGATTTVGNTLVVAAIATALPDSTSTGNFSAYANSNLTSLTERIDNARSEGNGGAIGIAAGIKATAGAYGNTTLTLATSSTKGMMSIALRGN